MSTRAETDVFSAINGTQQPHVQFVKGWRLEVSAFVFVVAHYGRARLKLNLLPRGLL